VRDQEGVRIWKRVDLERADLERADLEACGSGSVRI
jgi:hypothetical protein